MLAKALLFFSSFFFAKTRTARLAVEDNEIQIAKGQIVLTDYPHLIQHPELGKLKFQHWWPGVEVPSCQPAGAIFFISAKPSYQSLVLLDGLASSWPPPLVWCMCALSLMLLYVRLHLQLQLQLRIRIRILVVVLYLCHV